MTRLRTLAATATSPDEAREVTSRIAQITRAYRIQHGIGLPTNPAQQALEVDPKYVIRPHVSLLSERITEAVRDVEYGQNRRMIVSMPPRSGKSTLTSYYTPLWLLRRHPEWKIMMTAHDGSLAGGWARSLRYLIEDNPGLGIALKRDGGAGSRWETMEGGGLYATAVGAGLTGRGAKVLVIDDPISDFVAAHSPLRRQAVWDWWLSVAQTRLEPPYLVVTTMCMTGDTPVLRPDGTETPLRDIRPGDVIATYEDGRLTTSTVRNWANQGPDKVYEIRMMSGKTVRANARHPFLIVREDGAEEWVRLASLRAGMRVRSAVAPGLALSAQPRVATDPRSARECACPTTGRHAGQPGIGRLRSTPRHAEPFAFADAMASSPRSTTGSWMSRTVGARSADELSRRSSDRSTGLTSSVLTTITTPERCEVCSATTATSWWPEGTTRGLSEPPLTTWRVGTDEIVEIVEDGVEDVFDIQVDRTENFIANGLTSHNTRWHEDDFAGRLLNREYEGNPRDWEQVVLPAIADTEHDVLGRAHGQPLLSPLLDEDETEAIRRWDGVREAVGSYTWSGMYQQRPAPQKGAIFDTGWWRYWTNDPAKATEDGRIIYLEPHELSGGRWLDSWDCSFKGGEGGSWVVGQRWARMGANRYLIAQQRGRWSFTQTISRMETWAESSDEERSPCGHLVHERLIEDKANGPAIIDVLRSKISGIKPVNPKTSKEARARAVTPEIESGNVYLPHPTDAGHEWVQDLLSELRNFPHDVADDQVDTLTQALSGLRDAGRGSVSVPGRRPGAPGAGLVRQVPTNRAAAARTSTRRYR